MSAIEHWSEWGELAACIDEVAWFASRKKDLGSLVDAKAGDGRIWADVLDSDVDDLRKAVAELKRRALGAAVARTKEGT